MSPDTRVRGAAVAAALLALALTVQAAQAREAILKASPHSVVETMDRAARALDRMGLRVIGRIAHGTPQADGIPPMEVLVFGDPAREADLLLADRTSALDLPLRLVAWRDGVGAVWLAYDDPVLGIGSRPGIPQGEELLYALAGRIKLATDEAVALKNSQD